MVEFWAQDNNYGKRVNATLLGVQFVRDGAAFAGGTTGAAPTNASGTLPLDDPNDF